MLTCDVASLPLHLSLVINLCNLASSHVYSQSLCLLESVSHHSTALVNTQLPGWAQLLSMPGPKIASGGGGGFFLFSCLICDISGCVVSL